MNNKSGGKKLEAIKKKQEQQLKKSKAKKNCW